MLKKYALFVRGFIKMSTMIILLILMVTYYFYQDKIKEISRQAIEDNRKDGSLFYVEGIWNKMKAVQKGQDDRNQKVYEMIDSSE
ncbi:MAG TPA: hypothetical protein DEA43_04880 [Candidatus Moranbacteria bacterium]|nr:hypothetical protein [Candidatus Moranbacteria bacterium]HBT46187.1 hypothetical protein [Candidatus Moranbacteria bacterium]